MSLITTRSLVSRIMNSTNMATMCHLRPGLVTVSKKWYSTPEDKNVSSGTVKPLTFSHSPTNWDKRILVWTKKYPSVDNVPAQVSRETMDKARNKARIYTNILMAGLTIAASIAMIISGKRAAKRGESVQQMNLEWHQSNK